MKRIKNIHNVEYVQDKGRIISLRSVEDDEEQIKPLNFQDGATARYVASTILSDVDRQSARERNNKKKIEGKTLKERLSKITKRLTCGLMTIVTGNYHLNKSVLEHTLEIVKISEKNKLEKRRKSDLTYLKHCHLADMAKAMNPSDDVKKWKNVDYIKTFLKPLKNDSDGAMPSNREILEKRYQTWCKRGRCNIIPDDYVQKMFVEWKTNYEAKQGKKKIKKRK